MDKQAVVINKVAWTVTVCEQEVRVPYQEFMLLAFLAERPGRVVSRSELVSVLWDGKEPVNERVVDSYIARLRRRLGKRGDDVIRTVHKVGYRVVDSSDSGGPAVVVVSPPGE